LLQPRLALLKSRAPHRIVTLLDQRVLRAIREMRMLAPGDRAGVAVSGGSDSVALFHLLHDVRDRLGVTLAILHFDHMLRGGESETDAQFVAELARRAQVELILGRADVSAAAAKHKWNIEDAARRLRYAFFERAITEGKVTRVAVAHTADDQAETVLMHLLQGTGLPGLAGIYPLAGLGASQKHRILRPLLDVRRADLRDYLRARGASWREDSTNLDPRRFRAHIRSSLLPLLEREFTPQVTKRLGRVARLAREDEEFWKTLVEERFAKLVRATGTKEKSFTIAAGDLLAPLALAGVADQEPSSRQPRAWPLRTLTERMVRRLYQETRGELRGLTAGHVEQVIHLAASAASGRRVELPGGVSVERNFGELLFERSAQQASRTRSEETNERRSAFQYVVNLPERGAATTVPVPELRCRFHLKVIDWPAGRRETKRDSLALDAERLRSPLILRNWRPGDAYRPLGRRNMQKVKRLFLAGRVPSRERSQWPVLESRGRVAWVRGMPPAGDFCARAGTRAGVTIEEDQL
jgi:tRNA(Ile)-lysidine synthase